MAQPPHPTPSPLGHPDDTDGGRLDAATRAVLILGVLIALSVGAILLLNQVKPSLVLRSLGWSSVPAEPPSPAEAGAEQGGDGPTVRVADVRVRVSGSESDQIVRLSIDVAVATEKDRVKLGADSAAVRDAVISYLSSRRERDVRGSGALARLKQGLVERLQVKFPGVEVRRVYLADFVTASVDDTALEDDWVF
jgi:flagellar basal body-associated protein FliL